MGTAGKDQKLHWKSIFAHYWQYMRLQPVRHTVLLLAYGVGSLFTAVATPLLYKYILDALAEGGDDLADRVGLLFTLLALNIFVYNIIFRVADYSIIVFQNTILKQLADHVLENLMHKSYSFYANSFTGGIVAKSRRFVQAFEDLHGHFVFHIWMSLIELVASVIVLWYFAWELGVFFIGWLIAYAVLIRFMVRWSVPKDLASAEQDSNVTAHLSDILGNILTVKSFGSTRREIANFAQSTETQARLRYRAWMQDGFWNTMFQGTMVNLFELILVGLVLMFAVQGTASAGLVTIVLVYALRNFGIVWNISRNVMRIATALGNANEMVEILDAKPDVEDRSVLEPVRFAHGSLAFTGVHYAYENTEKVFADLTVTIPAGQKVALVGHSGAGKTTIVKLVLRFVDIESGSITIDGQDIRNVAQDELRRHIAYVPQEPLLFHRTLRENIAYAKPHATLDEVVEVARRAHAHDFIERLPKGYDTLVGERGIKLSGGERQRVAIARAMLADAPLVILDEATSSLDSVSERYIQKGFDALMEGRTTIVIAHRLSTIQHMDRIIVLDKGVVAEDGTHAELLTKGGIYAELWNSQVGGFIKE